MIHIYICEDCGKATSYLTLHKDKPNPQEIWIYEYEGCPKCGGNCVKTIECSFCGEYILGEFIKLPDGSYVCNKCYKTMTNDDLED